MIYNVKKVLIVKISAIGDVIMALPLAREIKKLYPGAEVTWLSGTLVQPILEQCIDIDQIITINESQLLRGKKYQQIAEVLKLWHYFKDKEYDLVLNGHVDERYKILTKTLKAPQRSWSRAEGRRPWPVSGRHHSDEYVRLAYDTDNFANPMAQSLQLSLASPSFFQRTDRPTVALAPGGAKNILADDFLRRWPISSYLQLAQELIEQGCDVLLTGASSDAWVSEAFHGMGPGLYDYIGQTDLLSLIGLYGAVDVVVTHDSGPLHLAGLAGAPLVALFGPTIPDEKAPRRTTTAVLWGGEDLACRPCYDGKNYANCPFPVCMSSIMVETVKQQVLSLIDSKEHSA